MLTEKNLSRLVCKPVIEFLESLANQRGLNLYDIKVLKNEMLKKRQSVVGMSLRNKI